MVKRATARSVSIPGEISPQPVPTIAEVGEWSAVLESFSDRPLYRNNDVELLIDGPATYRKMLDSIREAQELIYLETYIFPDDEVGRRFASALKERKKHGLTVAVIYDSVGSIRSDGSFFDDLERAGGRIDCEKRRSGAWMCGSSCLEFPIPRSSGAPLAPGSENC